MKRPATVLITAILLVLALPLRAAGIEAEGIALIDGGGIEQARRMAIRDAMRQASMQAGARVESSELVSANGIAFESSRMRATGELGRVSVLREWTDHDLLHVLIRAENNGAALSGSARSYKKKIVATPFTVNKSRQVEDLDDIWNGFPRELLRRLEGTNKFLPKVSKYSLPADAFGTALEANGEHIKQLARQNESQFVISGGILDAGMTTDSRWLGLSESRKRRFEIEVYVHDGMSGALIGHHRLERSIAGDVMVGSDKPFASAAFFATEFGKNVDWIMHALTKAILADLEHVPFTAKIVRITGGKIFLDAGASSLIAPGDKLVVYRRKDEQAVVGLTVNTEYGVPEAPVATLSITQVQPLFSIGEVSMDSKGNGLKVGDLVRFETIM